MRNALLLVLMCAMGCAGQQAVMKVGLAEVEITPPVGYRMSGYFYERLSTAVHDPLLAKAVVIGQGDVRCAIVICDVCLTSAEVVAQARKLAADQTGIPAQNILIAATHTHTGPEYFGILYEQFHKSALSAKGKDESQTLDYQQFFAQRIAQAIAEADKKSVETHISRAKVVQNNLAFNRRFHMRDGTVGWNPGKMNANIIRPAGPIDPAIDVLKFGDAGLLTSFALHSDTVGGTEYSGDYPFHLQQVLRSALGPKVVSIFAQGTSGNINHIDVSHNRPQKGHEEAARIGTNLAASVIEAAAIAQPIRAPKLAVHLCEVLLPVRAYTPQQVAEAREIVAKIQDRKLPFLIGVNAVRILKVIDRYHGQPVPTQVQAIALGADTAIVGLPSEVFVELGLAIKARSPFAHTILIELANDSFGYIPDKSAFEQGNYEPTNSVLEPSAGEKLIEAAVEALNRVHASR